MSLVLPIKPTNLVRTPPVLWEPLRSPMLTHSSPALLLQALQAPVRIRDTNKAAKAMVSATEMEIMVFDLF